MSRRDTIIVAVLVNTGLLAALFMMAMHNDTPVEVPSYTIAETKESEPVKAEVKQTPQKEEVASRDEIDEVLKTYTKTTQQPPVEAPKKKEEKVAPSQEENYVEVTVKKGDYLEKIARANGTTVNAIIRANHLPNAKISIGQVLRIPVNEKKAQSTAPSNEVAYFNEPQYYTIKSGDNPWKIAKQFHVRFDELLKLNDLDEAKARNLKPGDVLRVK